MKHTRFPIVSLIGVVALCVFCSVAAAQDSSPSPAENGQKSASFGVGLSMKYPYESFGDSYNTAYGIQGLFLYPLIPLLDFTANVGWNHFGKGDAEDSLDIWEFVGGLRFVMGVFFMSGEVAYYTEVDDTSFLPGLGLKFDHFEIAWNLRAVPSGSWSGLRLGWYF